MYIPGNEHVTKSKYIYRKYSPGNEHVKQDGCAHGQPSQLPDLQIYMHSTYGLNDRKRNKQTNKQTKWQQRLTALLSVATPECIRGAHRCGGYRHKNLCCQSLQS